MGVNSPGPCQDSHTFEDALLTKAQQEVSNLESSQTIFKLSFKEQRKESVETLLKIQALQREHEKIQVRQIQLEEQIETLQRQQDAASSSVEIISADLEETAIMLVTTRAFIKDRERFLDFKYRRNGMPININTDSPKETEPLNLALNQVQPAINIDGAETIAVDDESPGIEDGSAPMEREENSSRANSYNETCASTTIQTRVGDPRTEPEPTSSPVRYNSAKSRGPTTSQSGGREKISAGSSAASASVIRVEMPQLSEARDSILTNNSSIGRNFTPRAPKRPRAEGDGSAPRKTIRRLSEIDFDLDLMSILRTSADQVFTYNKNRTEFLKPDLIRGVPLARLKEGDQSYWRQSWVTLDVAFQKIEQRILRRESAEKDPETEKDTNSQKEDSIYLTERRLNLVKQTIGPGTNFHPNQLLTKKALTDDGLCNSHGIYDISRYIAALNELKANGVLYMKPEDFLRWRVIHICQRLTSEVSLPVKSILQKLDSRNKEERFRDDAMAFAMALSRDKEKMQSYRRQYLRHKG